MIGRRPWLTALGATALVLVVLAPTRMADGRLPGWMNLAADLRQVVDGLRRALHNGRGERDRPTRTAASPGLPGPGPMLEKPQAERDAAALKQAYAAAIATERLKGLGYDPTGILEAIRAYRADDLERGDALAQRISDPSVRTALEWVALRDVPQKIGLDRLNAFARAHPDWPARTWFRHQLEAHLLRVQDPKAVDAFFAKSPPVTPVGKFVLAKALKSEGRLDDAAKLAREVYRDNDLNPFLETRLKNDFGADLTKADFKYRADRLIYKDQVGAAMRAATQAGPDVVALERARLAIEADTGPGADKTMASVPAPYRNDPGLLLAEIQRYRHADKLKEALALMQSAPRDPAVLIDGDEWWTERRVLARKLLDANDPVAAYVVCASHSAVSAESTVDAEFHAGWIALRFMNEPKRAAWHFAQAANLAETPTSVARIAYWQGRTAANSIAPDAMARANVFYRKAAEHGSTYYGQLAREALGLAGDPVQEPATTATGMNRAEAVRVIELLYAAGDTDSAYALAVAAANSLRQDDQVAALAGVILEQQDAHLALTIGKMTGQRGIPVDPLAFPTFGIPPYEALQNSAAPPVVYAVARQESAFMPAVVSKAGAKGLMQMIDATARRTATKAGLPYDGARMLTDAAFNAKLGAAHLGVLLAEQSGSYILTFAAYNAGGGRVKQWIDAYGDPRQPGVDAVDWVERIPFTETRNYVQRVIANVNMYKAIFALQARAAAARRDRQAKL